jgi:hypothetical protein
MSAANMKMLIARRLKRGKTGSLLVSRAMTGEIASTRSSGTAVGRLGLYLHGSRGMKADPIQLADLDS